MELLDAPSAGGRSAEALALVTAFDSWRDGVQRDVLARVDEFVGISCTAELTAAGVDIAADVLSQFLAGGKCLRSTFAYLGWLCAAGKIKRHCAPRPASSCCTRSHCCKTT